MYLPSEQDRTVGLPGVATLRLVRARPQRRRYSDAHLPAGTMPCQPAEPTPQRRRSPRMVAVLLVSLPCLHAPNVFHDNKSHLLSVKEYMTYQKKTEMVSRIYGLIPR